MSQQTQITTPNTPCHLSPEAQDLCAQLDAATTPSEWLEIMVKMAQQARKKLDEAAEDIRRAASACGSYAQSHLGDSRALRKAPEIKPRYT